MPKLPLAFAGCACLLLGACSTGAQPAPPPIRYAEQAQAPAAGRNCDDFARSGGYPFLSGGRMGGNPNMLQLPGAKPLVFGPGDTDLERHLEEQDYLRNWCLSNPDRF